MKIYIIHLGNMNKRRNIYGRVTNTKQRDGKRQDLKDTNPLVRSGIDIINPALGNSASILTLKP
jgi:type II restriction/modification system DNA methylase subunit YeeA